jgi:hypothetical protein
MPVFKHGMKLTKLCLWRVRCQKGTYVYGALYFRSQFSEPSSGFAYQFLIMNHIGGEAYGH